MSEHKAFAKFPTTGGGYQYVDVFAIEAIGQGGTPELATIFVTGSERYYLVEVLQPALDFAGEPDAASWCLTLMLKVAQVELGDVFEEPTGESDDEDFGAPTMPYGPGCAPEFRKD